MKEQMNEELSAALQQFNDAAQTIARLWDDRLRVHYPFLQSFDEVAFDILEWVNETMQEEVSNG